MPKIKTLLLWAVLLNEVRGFLMAPALIKAMGSHQAAVNAALAPILAHASLTVLVGAWLILAGLLVVVVGLMAWMVWRMARDVVAFVTQWRLRHALAHA